MLKCPACSQALNKVREGSVEVDVCESGCGGAWFDATELDKIAGGAAISPRLLRPVSNKNVAIDQSRTRVCPRCASGALHRHYHDGDESFEVESCVQCGGIWLDLGELQRYQTVERSQAQQEQIVANYLRQASDPAKSKRMQAVLRLIFK